MSEHRHRSKLTCLFDVRDYLPDVKCFFSYKAVLLYLASYANPDGTNIFQSARSIAAGLGCDRNTARDALRYWLDLGILVEDRPATRTKAAVCSIHLPGGWVNGSPTPGTKVGEQVGERVGERVGEWLTPTELPSNRDTELPEEEGSLRSPAAAADRSVAFSQIGFDKPFGHVKFQKIFLAEFSKWPDQTEWLTAVMESTIQECQCQQTGVPPQFFEAKKDVEKRESIEFNNKRGRPPL